MTNEKKINPAEDEMLNEEAVENVSGGRLIGDFINPIEIERKENTAPNILIPGVLIPGVKDKNMPGESILIDDSEGSAE